MFKYENLKKEDKEIYAAIEEGSGHGRRMNWK